MEVEPAQVNPGTEVFLGYVGGWKLIPILDKRVVNMLRMIYAHCETRKRRGNQPTRILFFANCELCYPKGSWVEWEVKVSLTKAEDEGILDLIRSLPEHYATMHGPTPKAYRKAPMLLFPCVTAKDQSPPLPEPKEGQPIDISVAEEWLDQRAEDLRQHPTNSSTGLWVVDPDNEDLPSPGHVVHSSNLLEGETRNHKEAVERRWSHRPTPMNATLTDQIVSVVNIQFLRIIWYISQQANS